MSKFKFMGFGFDGGHDEMFVAHADKYSAEQTIERCLEEFEWKFAGRYGPRYRKPTLDDVIDGHCAFRFGVSPEWPDGCYTFVGERERGAFPVRVIEFRPLREMPQNNKRAPKDAPADM